MLLLLLLLAHPTGLEFYAGHEYVATRSGQVLRDDKPICDIEVYRGSHHAGLMALEVDASGIYVGWIEVTARGIGARIQRRSHKDCSVEQEYEAPHGLPDRHWMMPRFNHGIGDILAKGDFIYVSFGDGGGGGKGTFTALHLGTIYRIHKETGKAQRWATGLRNPWNLADTPMGILANDTGSTETEEVNLIRQGVDYGWPETEGGDQPIISYGRDTGIAITGGTWCAGAYYFADYTGKVWRNDFKLICDFKTIVSRLRCNHQGKLVGLLYELGEVKECGP